MSLNYNIQELSEEQLEELAEKISQKVVDHQDGQRRKIKEYAFQNTKLLLRNYDKLKTHCDIVNEQVTEELGTLWSDWRFDLDSLLEHKAKTAKLMKHVDRALLELKHIDESAYYLIKRKYINHSNNNGDTVIADEYSEKEGIIITRRGISKRIQAACNELAILLFGVDVILLKIE